MTRDLILVSHVDLLGILGLAFVDTVPLHTGGDPDVGVTEQETNLLESLVLGLGEEEVGNDGVGDVGDDEDHEVLPSEDLDKSAVERSTVKHETYVKTDGSNLTNDDVVEPIGSGGGSGTHSSEVHGEDLGLVNPRDRSERPSESPREAEERCDTGNTSTKVRITRLAELLADSGLPSETDGHEDRTDDEGLSSTELVDNEGDEDECSDDTPSSRETVDHKRSLTGETELG